MTHLCIFGLIFVTCYCAVSGSVQFRVVVKKDACELLNTLPTETQSLCCLLLNLDCSVKDLAGGHDDREALPPRGFVFRACRPPHPCSRALSHTDRTWLP